MTINRCIGLHHTAVIHTAAHRANKKLQPITVSVLFTQGLTVALRNYVRSIHSLFTVRNTPIDWIMIHEKQSTNLPRPFVTRHSLVRAKGEVFVTACFLFAFLSTISRQPTGRFKPNFACGRILVPNVSSPLLGLAATAGRKKWEIKFSLL